MTDSLLRAGFFVVLMQMFNNPIYFLRYHNLYLFVWMNDKSNCLAMT